MPMVVHSVETPLSDTTTSMTIPWTGTEMTTIVHTTETVNCISTITEVIYSVKVPSSAKESTNSVTVSWTGSTLTSNHSNAAPSNTTIPASVYSVSISVGYITMVIDPWTGSFITVSGYDSVVTTRAETIVTTEPCTTSNRISTPKASSVPSSGSVINSFTSITSSTDSTVAQVPSSITSALNTPSFPNTQTTPTSSKFSLPIDSGLAPASSIVASPSTAGPPLPNKSYKYTFSIFAVRELWC